METRDKSLKHAEEIIKDHIGQEDFDKQLKASLLYVYLSGHSQGMEDHEKHCAVLDMLSEKNNGNK